MSLIVLHIDDDPVLLMRTRSALTKPTTQKRFDYSSVANVAAFWKLYEASLPADCILLDMVIDDDDNAGVNILRELRRRGFQNPILMMSSLEQGSAIRACVEAGATDFITKGAEEAELLFRVEQAICSRKKISDQAREVLQKFSGETMREVYLKMPRVLASPVRAVLVNGESGTGKEVAATCLKDCLEPQTPFVTVNCAAISKDLLESELFGHEKGAFTGAQASKQGLFAVADGGWIFLDEVARLSQACQAALLRTLENGEIRPVGSNVARRVNVRVMAATNEDLDLMVEKGDFRGDLLQRLRAYEIYLPPLRERRDELGEILDALIARMNKQSSVEYRLAPAVRNLFLSYDWRKGNIREMWQVLQASTVEAENGLVTIRCLPRSFASGTRSTEISVSKPGKPAVSLVQPSADGSGRGLGATPSFPLVLTELEEQLLLDVLDQLKNQAPHYTSSQRKVAEALGITRHTLCAKLEKLDARAQLPRWLHELLSSKSATSSDA